MPNTSHALLVGARGVSNAIRNRAYSISFEVTRSCKAKCKHCHLSGAIPDEVRATAEDYAQRCRALKPVVAMVSGGEPLLRKDLEELERIIDNLREHKKKHNTVIASEYTFEKMMEYFKNLSVGNCRAGEKFLIVNPDATLSPCGLHIGNYASQKEIIANFLKNNTCGNCMTSIRANTEKPFKYQIKDALRTSRRSH